jgi:hypothetical protein
VSDLCPRRAVLDDRTETVATGLHVRIHGDTFRPYAPLFIAVGRLTTQAAIVGGLRFEARTIQQKNPTVLRAGSATNPREHSPQGGTS